MKSRSSYRIILPWMLLFIYFLGNMKVVTPYLEYKINYDFISQVLCVNKNKPGLKCLGKCHLTKELDKAAEEDAKKNETSSIQIVEIAAVENFIITFANTPVVVSREQLLHINPLLLPGIPENNTPPPKA